MSGGHDGDDDGDDESSLMMTMMEMMMTMMEMMITHLCEGEDEGGSHGEEGGKLRMVTSGLVAWCR